MCEVNKNNFEQLFPEIKKSIESAKFISVDLEFSALYPIKSQLPSLFDEPDQRYTKLRKNLEFIIPVQVGLTTFHFDPVSDSYLGNAYNFFVIPASFPTLQNVFTFQSETLEFLKFHNFDFNKMIYEGIPFMNSVQEEELRKKLLNNEVTEVQSNFKVELQTLFEEECEIVKKWYCTAAEGEYLSLPRISEKYKDNMEIMYFIHKSFRSKFKNMWTVLSNKEFILKKVSLEQYLLLNKEKDLDNELLDNLLGFTKVFRVLTSSKKPLVGHNLLQDILLMIHSFECPLPLSYNKFKQLANSLFPAIYDTKVISYELKKLVPEEKRWDDKGLQTLFEYFKGGVGRHIVLNSPAIDIQNVSGYGRYHEAGWDSFCAGYIFIRMAYLNVYDKYPKSKKFVSTELIAGLAKMKNTINIIRGSVSSIKLDSADPKSTRPPFLVVESIKNAPIDLSQVTAALSSFGFIEVKRLPYQNGRALVAVDNFGNARRILSNFKAHKDIRVHQYNALKHSFVLRAFIMSGLAISGAVMFMMTHSLMKR